MFFSNCCPTDWKMKNDTTAKSCKICEFAPAKNYEVIKKKINSLEYNDCVDNPKSSKILLDINLDDKILFQTMKHENNRKDSFNGKWPLHFLNVSDLAKAGFFYLQSDDRVQCAFCKLILHSWKDGDSPLREHIKGSPKCPFLTLSDYAMTQQQKPQQSTAFSNAYISVPSNSSTCKPKHPHFSDIKRRLSTFKGWPLAFISSEDLADCGLYYTGVADVVTCFFCGGSLGNWEPFDDPVTEHSKFYPHCIYLHLLKNRPIQRRPILQNVKVSLQQPIKHMLASELLKSDVVRQAKDIFPSALVESVVLHHLKETGQIFTSLHQLCEKVLENEEKKIKNRSPTNIEMNSFKVPQAYRPQNLASPKTEQNVFKNEHEKDSFLCKICMDREMGVAFQPCGHLVACDKCATVVSDCPICRKSIESKIKIYRS